MGAVLTPEMPRNLLDAVQRCGDEARRSWLAALPRVIGDVARTWSLDVGRPFQPGGQTSWVAPVRTEDGRDLVLKVGWRHPEAEHEAEGLREWNGVGAAQLYAATERDDTLALLIERCVPGTTLGSRPEEDQDVVIASLLRRLWCEPPVGHPFRPLQVMCDEWADAFEAKFGRDPGPVDAGLVRDGMTLLRALPASAPSTVLLVTDLHAGNVLAAQREPWLVIDPKPYVGDPTYDALQHMINCEARLLADPRGLTRRMADLLDLDAERLLLWLFARCVEESLEWPALGEVAQRVAPA